MSEYIDIIRRKTASLTATCCRLGAEYAGADDTQAARFETFGESVGIAFQIVDDVLDVVGEQKQMGKTLGRDLELGKTTLPVIHYLSEASQAEQDAMLSLLASADAEDRTRVASTLIEFGSVDHANSVAQEYVDRAISMLDSVPPSPSRASLIQMAEFILRRES